MNGKSSTCTSKGQLVVPVELRRKHGITAGTKIQFLEDQFGRIVLQPVNEAYIDQLSGCLGEGKDLVENLLKDRRREGKRGR
jgi:AbrB family looped-hinge helix DNA binding protein